MVDEHGAVTIDFGIIESYALYIAVAAA